MKQLLAPSTSQAFAFENGGKELQEESCTGSFHTGVWAVMPPGKSIKQGTFECWMGLRGIYQDVEHHHTCPPAEELHAPDQWVGLSCGMDLQWEEGWSEISLEGEDVGRTGNKLVLCHTYVEGTKMPVVHSMEIHRVWELNIPGWCCCQHSPNDIL